ncbi:MAG: hypothetical protein C0472_03570 [Erythrobacter sp.]|nr:hypothetical protein [Erythrobacter sp.]MBA4173922.1 hypothetical protein [Hyphomicrobium sp.]
MTTLPGVLAEIEEVAGRQAALTIAASNGGLTKGFPSPSLLEQSPESYANNWLVQCVGHELALKIVSEIFPAGGRAEIPTASHAIRREFILGNAHQLSVSEMATLLEMTERGVRRIKASLREEGLIA